MNSIRPLATVVILAVVGVGLYMVINTSEPITPEEAASASMDIPQIEDELEALIDEGSVPSPSGEATSVPPFSSGELTAPPAWSPPPSNEDLVSSSPVASGAAGAGQVPRDPAFDALPATSDGPGAHDTAGSGSGGIANPFTKELERQAHGGPSPQEVANPHAGNPTSSPHGRQAWGDIPSAEAVETLDSPLPTASSPPITSTPFSVAREAIEQLLRQRNLSQALLMLTEFCGDPQLTTAESAELDTLISQLAGTVIYSTEHVMEPAYRVQPGDHIDDIAARYQVSPRLLAKINGLADPAQLVAGSELKVVRGPFNAIVEQDGIRLLLDGRYAGRFAAQSSVAWPADAWTVGQKIGGEAALGGAPSASGKQILLTPENSAAGLTTAAILSGAPVAGETRPTVYVSEKDMDDLYDILTVGSRVTVRR